MTGFDIRKNQFGQEFLEKVTLKLKGCKYAADDLPHSGIDDGSCYGFSPTCSAADSYDDGAFRDIVFSTGVLPAGSKYLSGLSDIRFKRPVLKSGEDMGARGELVFTISDQVHNDVNIVPYADRQTNRGTLLGKLRARHPHFSGVEVVYSYGFRDSRTYDEPDWIGHSFFIEEVKPSSDSMVFECVDVLSLADEKKAQMPIKSYGRLSTSIVDSSSGFTVTGGAALEYGDVGDQVRIKIGAELLFVEVSGDYTFNIISRQLKDTLQEDHDINETVQLCYYATDIHVIDLTVDALQGYSQVPSSHIGDYSEAKANTPDKILSEVLLEKPYKTKEIIDTCIKLGELKFYSDVALRKIVIKADNETDIQAVTFFEEKNIIDGSIQYSSKENDQITHFIHKWGRRFSDDKYLVEFLAVDAGLIAPKKRGGLNIGKEFKNILLTTSSNDILVGAAYSSRKLAKTRYIPETIKIKVPTKFLGAVDGGVVDYGSIISLAIQQDQNPDGTPASNLYEVVNISGGIRDHFTLTLSRYQSPVINSGDVDFSVEANQIKYDLSEHFQPAEAGNYTVYLSPGVIFGSDDVDIPTFTTGAQNPGVEFHIIFRSKHYGMGGRGRDYGVDTLAESGGICVEITTPCTMDVGEGLIYAGGGGSSSSYFDADAQEFVPPGGGQGYSEALGGYDSVNDRYGESGDLFGPGGENQNYGLSYQGRGGEFGEAGGAGLGATADPGGAKVFNGGDGGIAIKTNGNALSITSGNNEINIRGRIE